MVIIIPQSIFMLAANDSNSNLYQFQIQSIKQLNFSHFNCLDYLQYTSLYYTAMFYTHCSLFYIYFHIQFYLLLQFVMESQIPAETFLMKRREMMLQKVKSRREEIFNKTRNILAHQDVQPKKQSLPIMQFNPIKRQQITQTSFKSQEIQEQRNQKQGAKQKKYKKNQKLPFYYNFQYPDWMIQIPTDLIDFYVAPRPKGQRVLLVFKQNKLIIYSQQGLTKTQILLNSKHYDGSVLEGYYVKNQASEIVLISDLLIWRKNQMVSSQFEFRIAWILSNLSTNVLNEINSTNKRKIVLTILQYLPFSGQNLFKLYQNITNQSSNLMTTYQVDGILFLHKQSFYLYEVNPHVLFWKDQQIDKSCQTSSHKACNSLPAKSLFSNNNSNNNNISSIQSCDVMTQQNQYFVDSNSTNESSINMGLFFNKYNCEHQLQKLSINNIQQQQIQSQNVFYGKITKNGKILTFDEVFLVLALNHNQPQQKVIKFSFKDMSYEFSSHNEQENQMDQENINEVTVNFSNFMMHQTFQMSKRLPDCLTKIIFKYKMKSQNKANKNPGIQQILSNASKDPNMN